MCSFTPVLRTDHHACFYACGRRFYTHCQALNGQHTEHKSFVRRSTCFSVYPCVRTWLCVCVCVCVCTCVPVVGWGVGREKLSALFPIALSKVGLSVHLSVCPLVLFACFPHPLSFPSLPFPSFILLAKAFCLQRYQDKMTGGREHGGEGNEGHLEACPNLVSLLILEQTCRL